MLNYNDLAERKRNYYKASRILGKSLCDAKKGMEGEDGQLPTVDSLRDIHGNIEKTLNELGSLKWLVNFLFYMRQGERDFEVKKNTRFDSHGLLSKAVRGEK